MKYDLLVWGASGFTGTLIFEYLVKKSPKEVKLAIGGRDREKLERLRDKVLSESEYKRDIGILIGNNDDQESLDRVVEQCRVVISSVGPFLLYGIKMVDSCVRYGSDYLDLTGEAPFIKKCIDNYEQKAISKGVIIVNACGYDSVPSDIGTFMVSNYMRTKYNRKCKSINVYQGIKENAGLSGGTLASVFAMAETSSLAEASPYLLCKKKGMDKGDIFKFPKRDNHSKRWLAGFPMAVINGSVVRRSNEILGYGSDFHYQETYPPMSFLIAFSVTLGMLLASFFLIVKPLRMILKRFLPQPGQGPSREAMKKASYKTTIIGETEGTQPNVVKAIFQGFKDPGYSGTSELIAEAALALVLERDKLPGKKGGLLTPAAAFGQVLIDRLKGIGMNIEVIE